MCFFFRSISCAMRQDVCFFHPFDDCNSRMARLVLDFLLTREGETMVAGVAWGVDPPSSPKMVCFPIS